MREGTRVRGKRKNGFFEEQINGLEGKMEAAYEFALSFPAHHKGNENQDLLYLVLNASYEQIEHLQQYQYRHMNCKCMNMMYQKICRS
jgi:hypothetical protein